jgi:GNAT superfamily N-acetyltransferase
MPAATDMRFERITTANQAGFGELLRIYQASIELSEQKPPEALAPATHDPRYRIWVLWIDQVGVGFSMAFLPQAGDFWLLEYMAVAGLVRSRGLGAKLFANAAEDAHALGREIGLLEVDAVKGEAEILEERRRRQPFTRAKRV